MSEAAARPRMLVTIAHYYHEGGQGYFGSTGSATPAHRARALGDAIKAFVQLFGARQTLMVSRKPAVFCEVNTAETYDIDVVVCTLGGRHLLDRLEIPESWYINHVTRAVPHLLPFECHAVLRERLGDYDLYCYLEDDMVVQDPWFFVKTKWFTGYAGEDAVLLPNRFELSVADAHAKMYIDAHVSPDFTRKWQDISDRRRIRGKVMGARVVLERPYNPHAGCFFLTAAQMAEWTRKPYFLDRKIGFGGPMASAATLNLMRAFRVYKPAPVSAGFLEILHASNRYLGNWLKRD